jgi:hypothetical protein
MDPPAPPPPPAGGGGGCGATSNSNVMKERTFVETLAALGDWLRYAVVRDLKIVFTDAARSNPSGEKEDAGKKTWDEKVTVAVPPRRRDQKSTNNM